MDEIMSRLWDDVGVFKYFLNFFLPVSSNMYDCHQMVGSRMGAVVVRKGGGKEMRSVGYGNEKGSGGKGMGYGGNRKRRGEQLM